MTRRSRSRGGDRPSADGLTQSLNTRAGLRRKRNAKLAEIERHEPAQRNDLLPRLNVRNLPVDELRPARRRVRREDAAQIARIANSIATFGVCQPILVDGESRIVHGHGVWEAARKLGLPELPTISIEHLSESELRLLSVALNRLPETGRWNMEALQLELRELIDLDEDVYVTGFEPAEIDLILLDEDGGFTDDEEEEPLEVGMYAVSQAGDSWKLGKHRLCQGDALDPETYGRLFADGEGVRLVLTDPPYNVAIRGHVTGQPHHRDFAMASGEMNWKEFRTFNADWMGQALTRLVDGGLLATFIDWRSIELILACGRELGLSLLNLITWVKPNGGQGSLWRSQHELLPVFKNGKAAHVNNVALGRYGRWRSNVWTYAGASSLGSEARASLEGHPTVKPRALLEDALLDVTNRDEIVLDPFAGSGSTLIAAETTGRICRAIEIDGLYCDLIVRRWQAMTGEAATLAETGETFDEVAARREVKD